MTIKRKADREKMAAAIAAMVEVHGFTAVTSDPWLPTIYKRAIHVEVSGPRGVRVGVEFNGESGINGWVLTWNAPVRPEPVSFSKAFACQHGMQHHNPYGLINQVTRVYDDYYSLYRYLEMDCEAIRNGSAFDDALAAKYLGHIESGEMPWQQGLRKESEAA